MKISIVGTGYVGLVTGTCFADLGNHVICVDKDRKKIEDLKKGIIPIYEPGLEKLVKKNVRKGRLSFNTSVQEGVKKSEIIFIAVGTPSKDNGEADLTYVEEVSRTIAKSMKEYKIIVEKSTVPVRTGEWVKRTVQIYNVHDVDFDVVSNPEFLREGTAIEDFLHPDRVVLGVESERAKKIMKKLYAPLKAPIVFTDIKSSEIIKHASNSFLALKISYINAIANICELVNADVEKVAKGVGLDKRIGSRFLKAGIGYGGSCFPKDISAFIQLSSEVGYDFELLKVVQKINKYQKKHIMKKIKETLWVLNNKTVGVLGLSFKPNTDDVREAPSIEIVEQLQKEGAKIRAYDPAVDANKGSKIFGSGIKYCSDPYSVCRGSDALLILTEWDEFKELDLGKVKKLLITPTIIDGRNIFDAGKMNKLGFRYVSIGR